MTNIRYHSIIGINPNKNLRDLITFTLKLCFLSLFVPEDVSLANCVVCGGSYLVCQEYVSICNSINVDSVHINSDFSNYLCLLGLHMYLSQPVSLL